MILDPSKISTSEVQLFLQHIVAPRPIGLVSSINKAGQVNLSPFSFFNLFSSNPPIVIFSPARRVRDNTQKHTLENVLEVPEVVINMVSYDMVQQTSLASTEYHRGINEFTKAGLTEEKAQIVKAPMVKESKAKLECNVIEIKELGKKGGAGNLVICEVLMIHIQNEVLDAEGHPNPSKLQQVARLGGDWYTKVNDQSLFMVPKPNKHIGMGIDALPAYIRNSEVFTGNDLAQLANATSIPEIDHNFTNEDLTIRLDTENKADKSQLHRLAKKYLSHQDLETAWQLLLREK